MSEGVYNLFTHRSTVSTDVNIGYAPINRLENGPYAKKDTTWTEKSQDRGKKGVDLALRRVA